MSCDHPEMLQVAPDLWECPECGALRAHPPGVLVSMPAIRGDIQPHFNHSLGQYVGSRRQMNRIASERGLVERPWRCSADTPSEERGEMIGEEMTKQKDAYYADLRRKHDKPNAVNKMLAEERAISVSKEV